MGQLSAAEELVYAVAFATFAVTNNDPNQCAKAAARAVQKLREASGGAPKSRTAVQRMLVDFRKGVDE